MADVKILAPKTEPIAKALTPVLRGAEGLIAPVGIGLLVVGGLYLALRPVMRGPNGRQRAKV